MNDSVKKMPYWSDLFHRCFLKEAMIITIQSSTFYEIKIIYYYIASKSIKRNY